MARGGDMANKRWGAKDEGNTGQQAAPNDQGRPKRVRRPSLKVLERVDGSGSSVEAILPSHVSSYVSSGSSLLTLAAGAEENDTARVVPELGMYTGMYPSHLNGNTAAFTNQASGSCPSKQGSNEQEGGTGEGRLRCGKTRQPHGVPSSLICSMTDVKFPISASELGEGQRTEMGGAHGGNGCARGNRGNTAGVRRDIGKLQEYYGSHQAYYMESMTHLIGAMSHKAQQMVLEGENLSSMRMKEALDAVATANAIIWRASAAAAVGGNVVNGAATAMFANESGAVGPSEGMHGAAAVMVSPLAAVVTAPGEACAAGKNGVGEEGGTF